MNVTQTICFSGHRPDRLPGHGNPIAPESQALTTALRRQLEHAVAAGKDTFLNGYMAGWDIMAAEQVIALKARHPHIQLVTLAPYSTGYFARESCWTADWIARAMEVRRQSDIFFTVAARYRPGIYYERNRALVDNASLLLGCWDGGKGGTAYTVAYARQKGLEIVNCGR